MLTTSCRRLHLFENLEEILSWQASGLLTTSCRRLHNFALATGPDFSRTAPTTTAVPPPPPRDGGVGAGFCFRCEGKCAEQYPKSLTALLHRGCAQHFRRAPSLTLRPPHEQAVRSGVGTAAVLRPTSHFSRGIAAVVMAFVKRKELSAGGELEMFHMGVTKCEGRKTVVIPRRMFVDRPLDENKQQQRGRFGLMCFTANRDKSDWDRCECDHMNGDPTDDREENVRWLTPADNKRSYHNKRAQRSNAARA